MLAWLMIGGGIHGTHLAHLLTTAKGVAREELRVLDPHPEPLARWNRLTANTGMAYLRSPAVHNLGLTPDALDKFAASPAAWVYRTYREPYSRPGYELFQAHAHQLVREHMLADLWLQGSAQRLIKRSNGWQVETTAGALIAHASCWRWGAPNSTGPLGQRRCVSNTLPHHCITRLAMTLPWLRSPRRHTR